MKTLSILASSMLLVMSCNQASVELPKLSNKTSLHTKTTSEYNLVDSTSQFSEETILEKEMCAYLLGLAKQGNIAAYKNAGPWGEELIPLQPNEINDALMVVEEYELDGEFLTRNKQITVNEMGPVTFQEQWKWNAKTKQMTKQVERVTFSQLITDEDGFVIGGRALITLVFK